MPALGLANALPFNSASAVGDGFGRFLKECGGLVGNYGQEDRPIFDNEVLPLNGADQYGDTGIPTQSVTSFEYHTEIQPSTTGILKIIFDSRDAGGSGILISLNTTGRIIFELEGTSVQNNFDVTGGDYMGVSCTWDGSEMIVSVDGVEFSAPNTATGVSMGVVSIIGSRSFSSPASHYSGNISNTRILANGTLLAQYDLQGNGLDASGNDNHLTLVNNPTFVVDNSPELASADRVNAVGCGIEPLFNGSNEDVKSPFNGDALNSSFEFDYINTGEESGKYLCCIGSTSSATPFIITQMASAGGGVIVRMRDDSNVSHLSALNGVTSIRDGLKHRIRVEISSSEARLFIDGVIDASQNHTATAVSVNTFSVSSLTRTTTIYGLSGIYKNVHLDNSLIYGETLDTLIPAAITTGSDKPIPAHATLEGVDYLGNPLTYGAAYPAKPIPVDSNCLSWDGTTQYISIPSLTGSEIVVSFIGTSTPTVSAGQIDFTVGYCSMIELSNGSIYPLAEGGGTIAYDVSGNGIDGTYTGSPVNDLQDVYPYNLYEGFTQAAVKIPADLSNIGFDADGSPLTNPYVKNGHNDSETLFNFTNLTTTGNQPPAIAATGQTLTDYSFGDTLTNPFFKRTISAIAEDRHSLFSEALTGACLEKASRFFSGVGFPYILPLDFE